MELLLIRHARPFHATDAGGADPELTPDGRDQARRLAAALAGGRYDHIDRIVSSPMQRAVQTAHEIGQQLGIQPSLDEWLCEFDRGWTTYGIDQSAYGHRSELFATLNAGRLRGNTFDPMNFRARVVSAIEDVMATVDDDTERVAIVCHGGVINAYLTYLLNQARTFAFDPYYTSITRILAETDGYREIRSINETAHLEHCG